MADLASRLKTELTRSPKKTAILAVGLVVAAVFWGRMLWKPSNGGETAAETRPASSQLVAPVVPAGLFSRSLASGGSPESRTTGAGEPTWHDLLVWMRSSFAEETIDSSADVGRDPFDASDPTLAHLTLTEELSPETDAEGETPADDDAHAPGSGRDAVPALAVQGILKIGDRRFVRLGGKTLATGESFEVSDATNANGPSETWVVVGIASDRVAIRRSTGGEPAELTIAKPAPPGVRINLPERE